MVPPNTVAAHQADNRRNHAVTSGCRPFDRRHLNRQPLALFRAGRQTRLNVRLDAPIHDVAIAPTVTELLHGASEKCVKLGGLGRKRNPSIFHDPIPPNPQHQDQGGMVKELLRTKRPGPQYLAGLPCAALPPRCAIGTPIGARSFARRRAHGRLGERPRLLAERNIHIAYALKFGVEGFPRARVKSRNRSDAFASLFDLRIISRGARHRKGFRLRLVFDHSWYFLQARSRHPGDQA